MFEGVKKLVSLRRTQSREFANGKVVLSYEPAGVTGVVGAE